MASVFVFDWLQAWSNTGNDECLISWIAVGSNAARRIETIQIADSRVWHFKSRCKKSEEESVTGLVQCETTKGCDSPGDGEESWQSKQGWMREHDGEDRLHYVRDRAKLLGIWIIETKLSHLCLQSSRYFKRSCSLDHVADDPRAKKETWIFLFLCIFSFFFF